MDNTILRAPKDRNLFFTRQVDQGSIADLTKQIIDINYDDQNLIKTAKILGFEYNPEPIKIYIDSYGGSVYQVLGLLGIMENSKTSIHTICTGVAMSCGFMILITGHKRYCHKYSTPLYHQISKATWGVLKELEAEMVESKRLMKILEDITLSKTKITKTQLKDIYDKKIDWFMSPAEAKKLGVVDEVL